MPTATASQTPTAAIPDDISIVVDGTTIVFADVAAHVVTINVPDAEQLLERNATNRPIDRTNLAKLITDVENGDFLYNGSSIVMSSDGCLLDGQHRLLVIIKTGVSLQVVISTGVQSDAQRDMDSGKSRTLTDNLAMNGEAYAPVLSRVLLGIQAWELGERSSKSTSRGITINTSFRFLEAHPETREIAKQAYLLGSKIDGFGAKPLGQFIWAFDQLSVDDRVVFFEKLETGEALAAGDPILQLRNFLLKDAGSRAKVNPYHRSAMLIKAWNMWRAGDNSKLSFRPGGSKPEAFPEPV